MWRGCLPFARRSFRRDRESRAGGWKWCGCLFKESFLLLGDEHVIDCRLILLDGSPCSTPFLSGEAPQWRCISKAADPTEMCLTPGKEWIQAAPRSFESINDCARLGQIQPTRLEIRASKVVKAPGRDGHQLLMFAWTEHHDHDPHVGCLNQWRGF